MRLAIKSSQPKASRPHPIAGMAVAAAFKPVAQLVVTANQRQKPRRSAIGGKGIEPATGKGTVAVQAARRHQSGTMTKPTHHHHTAAMTAKRVKHPGQGLRPAFAKMWHPVFQIGDIAPPAM